MSVALLLCDWVPVIDGVADCVTVPLSVGVGLGDRLVVSLLDCVALGDALALGVSV